MATPISRSAARRITIAAQGLATPRPRRVTRTQLLATLDRLGVVQIDSINVLQRSHYLPFYSRLGNYNTTTLDTLAATTPLAIAEYWGHEASIVPTDIHQHLSYRMATGARIWGSMGRAAKEHPEQLPIILDYLNQHGPHTAKELTQALETQPQKPKDHWGWNWSTTKSLCEYLFHQGHITSVGRTTQFERRYDLMANAVSHPPNINPDADHTDALTALTERALAAVGIGTLERIADYYRLPKPLTHQALTRLHTQGIAQPTTIEGLTAPHWKHTQARTPRSVTTRALLSPFDSLVWHRPSLEQLFGIRHRLEVYVPAAKRQFGYYVLLFLLDEQFVARVDLKHDRPTQTLLVQQVSRETTAPEHTMAELDAELWELAHWLGAQRVQYV